MDQLTSRILPILTNDTFVAVLRALVVLVVGLVMARIVATFAARLLQRRGTAQQILLGRRIAFWTVFTLAFMSSLRHLGFDLGILLGAAGILTVALGFASQTSASNLISGLFLLGERPFVVGDVIRVGTTTGEVVSLDLLSVKLRTFDNLSVRIPNETLLKTEITTLTRYPIRRMDLQIGVAYKEDLRRVFEILFDLADAQPLCLDEPNPKIFFTGFGESSLNLQFSVWALRENFIELKTEMYIQVKEAFDEAGIEIPFPHRSLYAGSVTDPIPVEMVRSGEPPAP